MVELWFFFFFGIIIIIIIILAGGGLWYRDLKGDTNDSWVLLSYSLLIEIILEP